MKYPGIYISEISNRPRTIFGVPTSICAVVGRTTSGPMGEPMGVASLGEFERTFGGLGRESPVGTTVRDFFANGGTQAIVVRVEEDAILAGVHALDGTQTFNLLCIPPPSPEGDTPPEVYAAALDYCVARRAILLIDPPRAWTTGTVATIATGLVTLGLRGDAARNAALYFPPILALDPPVGGIPTSFPPSGAVAGVIARTDVRRGIWKSPAGIEASLRGVVGLSRNLNDAQVGALNGLGVNCLRKMPNGGAVVWGARTLRGSNAENDEYKYLSVRRLALYIEESVLQGTPWAMFEPNDEPLWAQLRLSVGEFMHGLFRAGALAGDTPPKAYFVKCDRETMTQADLDHGFVVLMIGFAPLKPAEFVVLCLRIRTGGAGA